MIHILHILTALFVLAALALFFSVNAIALRTFSRAKLQQAFKDRNKESKVDGLVENIEKMVLSCSVYRVILNMGILLLMVYLFSEIIGNLDISVYLASFMASLLVISVFSVAIPHAWAKYSGEKILSGTYGFLLVLSAILWPILWVLKLYDGLVRRLSGVAETTPEEEQEELEEEFLTGLEERKMEGVVDEEEQEMIESVLELRDTTVSEIMTPRTDLVALDVNSTQKEVLETITREGHSRIPVYEENVDSIVGFVYAKDLLADFGKSEDQFRLKDKLRDAYFVPETKSLRSLLHEFQNQKLHVAVVLDEYGGTAGIVTLEDILEELVGEIADEYEPAQPQPIKVIDKNNIDVDARIYIDDVNDDFELNLPEDEDFDTVGGFVFSHLGYIPKAGESFEYQNLKFVITSAESRKINRIRISKINGGKNAQ